MKNIVVWGAEGFVGRNLVIRLKENSHVYAVVKKNSDFINLWEKEANITVIEERDLVRLNGADIMFFLAWSGTSGTRRGDVDVQLENVKLTCRAVQCAADLHCEKFIYAGSIMEYEAIEYLNKDGSVPGRNYIYSVSKLTADYYAKILANDLGVKYCNALISNIYGPGEISQRFVVTMCKKLLNNEVISLTEGTQLYDFIYISDAVRALEYIAERGEKNNTYYIGNKSQRTLREFILEMKKILESKSELKFGTVDFTGVSLSYAEFDTKKMYDTLGFKCDVDFKEGILKTAQWIRKMRYDEDL